jgi:hypothetical protein
MPVCPVKAECVSADRKHLQQFGAPSSTKAPLSSVSLTPGTRTPSAQVGPGVFADVPIAPLDTYLWPACFAAHFARYGERSGLATIRGWAIDHQEGLSSLGSGLRPIAMT